LRLRRFEKMGVGPALRRYTMPHVSKMDSMPDLKVPRAVVRVIVIVTYRSESKYSLSF